MTDKNIAASTTAHISYPGYLNASESSIPSHINWTVRTQGKGGQEIANVDLTLVESRIIANDILKHLNGDHEGRMRQELKELSARMGALANFMENEDGPYGSLDVVDQDLLLAQVLGMGDYCVALTKRVAILNQRDLDSSGK